MEVVVNISVFLLGFGVGLVTLAVAIGMWLYKIGKKK